MRSRFAAVLAALVVPLFAVTACGSDEPVVEVVTTTIQPSPSATTSATTNSSPSEVPAQSSTSDTTAACGAYGITGAPGSESARCLDKQIASCGDASIHQMGTTFFTDGTTGWTQSCQNSMSATYVPPAPEPSFDQDAYNQQFAEEYWRNNPRPTFDPDSADGYGPDQKLPPACLRFENVDC